MNDFELRIKSALDRGKKMINLPVMMCITLPVLIMLLPTFNYKLFGSIPYLNGNYASFILLLALPSAWVIWSVQVPRWKLWAYAQMQTPDELRTLKILAIRSGLIWPDGHIFEKTEICSKEVRQKILQLEGRL